MNETVNQIVTQFQALSPKSQEIALRYLDLLLQVQENAETSLEAPEIED